MQNLLEWLSGKKTYLLCLGTMIGLWTTYFQGAIDLQHAIDGTVLALGGMTMRAAVTKSGPQT